MNISTARWRPKEYLSWEAQVSLQLRDLGNATAPAFLDSHVSQNRRDMGHPFPFPFHFFQDPGVEGPKP
jgi:hypothetical protein